MQVTPMYTPEGFEPDTAVRCTDLINGAYDQYAQWKRQREPSKREFRWQPTDVPGLEYGNVLWARAEGILWREQYEPFGFVAWDSADTTFLVLRGTQSGANWLANLDAELKRYGLVSGYGPTVMLAHGDGFYTLYKTLRRNIFRELGSRPTRSRLVICGHSLGGALSTLSVPDIIKNTAYKPGASRSLVHYSLAAPRAANIRFARTYNGNGVPTYRIVNTEDLVPDVPPAVMGGDDFCHVGTPVQFTAQYGSLAGNHSTETAYQYALEHPERPWKLA